jgi:hypothetical protein
MTRGTSNSTFGNVAYTGQLAIPQIQITGPGEESSTHASHDDYGTSPHPLLSARAGSTQRAQLYGNPQTGTSANKVKDLASISRYPESSAKTHILVQGEACFISANSRMRGLFTFGAGPCSILMITARNQTEESPAVIGAGHIDSYVSDAALDKFFARVAGFRKVEASVIGGCDATVERILRAAKRANAELVFVAPNSDESRIDDAAMDKSGRIYYGVKDFSDPQRPEMMKDIENRMAAPREPHLSVEEQLRITTL